MRTIYNSFIHPYLIYGLYLWGFSPKRLTVLQKKAVRILSLRPYVSHSTPLFQNLKILKIEDQYSIQLYKLYYKNTNNLLPHYFNGFTPYYNNEEHGHNLRSTTLRLPMTRREFFVQSTKYQFPRLVRDTPVIDLNRTDNSTICQFSTFFKYSIINRYDPVCVINQSMYVDDLFFFFKGRFYLKINKIQHKKTTIIYKIYTNPPPQRFQTLYIISKI